METYVIIIPYQYKGIQHHYTEGGYSRKETAQIIGEVIRSKCYPESELIIKPESELLSLIHA